MKHVEAKLAIVRDQHYPRMVIRILIDGSPVARMLAPLRADFIVDCIRSDDLSDKQIQRVIRLSTTETVNELLTIYDRAKAILAVVTWAKGTNNNSQALMMLDKSEPVWRRLAGDVPHRPNHLEMHL